MSDALSPDWDFIVIGGGLAGSISAAELGRAGFRVLVLEAGNEMKSPPPTQTSLLKKIINRLLPKGDNIPAGRMPKTILAKMTLPNGRVKTNRFPALLGTGPGGSSQIYSSALGRFKPDDFGENTSSERGGLDNRWPLDWKDFEPYYDRAEQLMGVVGTPDPLDPSDTGAHLSPPPKVGPRDIALVEKLSENGRHPFHLHVGFEYRPGCSECLGAICNRDCKATGFNRALRPALDLDTVTLWTGIDVLEIHQTDTGLAVSFKADGGAIEKIRGAHVICAAGALISPTLLLDSEDLWKKQDPPEMLGRGLMFHMSDIFAVRGAQESKQFGPQKTIGLRDHYNHEGIPLGEVQSFGAAVQTGLVSNYLISEARKRGFSWLGPFLHLARLPAAIAAKRFRHATLFATVLEDMPYASNRVLPSQTPDTISIEYTLSEDVLERNLTLRHLIKDAFTPFSVDFFSTLGTPNWGHPCGTARMGDRAETSAVTPSGQLWGHPNITVIDASTFPSSAGANPSLTIVANALRITDHIKEQMAQQNAEKTA